MNSRLKLLLFGGGGVLLLAVGAVVVSRLFSGGDTAEPVGTLSPEEINEEPLVGEEHASGDPLFSGSGGASPAPTDGSLTISEGQTQTGTLSAEARLAQPSSWEGQADADGDSLPDAAETVYKTDPAKADSDGDGFPDGEEIRKGYDPLRPGTARLDSDGDGLLEHEEFEWKSDPFRADTDGDGFPDGAEVKNEYNPTIRGDGTGNDALPSRRAREANASLNTLRPDPNSENYTEGLAGVLLGDRPVSQAGQVQVTPERVQQILDAAKLQTTLPEVKRSDLTIGATNTPADISTYTQAITNASPSDLTQPSTLSVALTSAFNGSPQRLADIRARLQQYITTLERLSTPPSALEHHVLLIGLVRFVNDRLGVIQRSGSADPAKSYIAARELQQGLQASLPKLQSLRTELDRLSATR